MMDHGRDKSLSPDIMRLSNLLHRNPASRLFVPLAEAYLKSGMRDEAILVLTNGIRHHPTFVAALVMLGKIYLQMGDRTKAKDQFEQAIKINPENIPSLKSLGAIYQEEKQLRQALEAYRAILMIDPSDKAARRLFVALEAEASVAPELERTSVGADDAASPLPADTAARREDVAEPSDSQALTQAQAWDIDERDDRDGETGEHNEAESVTEEAVETPTLASIYMNQGCYKEAADIYNKLLARDPSDSESRRGLEEALSRLSDDSKQAAISSAPSLHERKIARLEAWLHTIQSERRG